jgi:hypothetical protein
MDWADYSVRQGVDIKRASRGRRYAARTKKLMFNGLLLPLLVALPRETALLYDTFYSSNCMVLKDPVNFSSLYPPRSFNHFVRRLKFGIDLQVHHLEWLRGSVSRFECLSEVELSVNGLAGAAMVDNNNYNFGLGQFWGVGIPGGTTTKVIDTMLTDIEAMEPIVIRTKVLRVNYTHAFVRSDPGQFERYKDTWEMPPLNKIRNTYGGHKVKEHYERWNLHNKHCSRAVGNRKMIVEDWPMIQGPDDGWADEIQRRVYTWCDRNTAKITSI